MKSVTSEIELAQLHTAGNGLIYNDFSRMGSSGKDYNILHTAFCTWVLRSNTNVPKFFFSDIDEAVSWLNRNRGKEGVNWKRCGTCRAMARPASKISSEELFDVTKMPMPGKTPFVEAEVEQLLVNDLRANGYAVQMRLQVPSGIVDVAASGQDGRWIIEVKGEDRGGYGSAEMNFQMGIGQLVSRMTDPSMTYALAFPMTDDYKRVLRKYRGSLGFSRLGLWFFTVHRNAAVDKYDAPAMAAFIDTL